MAALMQRMQSLATPGADARERIKVIRAGVGNTVRMIPVADVVCFEATEKYVNVVTVTGEALVRVSLRELMARIDSTDFIQVHRSVMVNSSAIVSATRDENGQAYLEILGVHRLREVLLLDAGWGQPDKQVRKDLQQGLHGSPSSRLRGRQFSLRGELLAGSTTECHR